MLSICSAAVGHLRGDLQLDLAYLCLGLLHLQSRSGVGGLLRALPERIGQLESNVPHREVRINKVVDGVAIPAGDLEERGALPGSG